MKSKGFRTCLMIGVGIILITAVFISGAGVGYVVSQRLDTQEPTMSGPFTCPPCPSDNNSTNGEVGTAPFQCPACPYVDAEGDTPEEYQELFAPFWEAWDIVHERYVDQPVDDLALMRGAIEGMLNALGDRHTSYMTPEQFTQANEALAGEYEGIGAWVDTAGDYVEIISPMRGSPAEQAGLQPNDLVIAVDGEDMTGIPGDLVLTRIIGPAGTQVTLTIQRIDEVFDVSITRAKIVVPTVEYEILEDNIAYIGLYSYGENTTQQLRNALNEILAQNPDGLILDLRDNGGGFLNTAIQVVSEFIGEGVVMYSQQGDGDTLSYEAIPGGLAIDIPLVVLVNEITASAAEITAGAIQDYGRAPLVGVTTYGKGSVQRWIGLENNAGAVRVTTDRWLTPNGRQISGEGLEPDYVVEMTPEDYAEGRDPQLDKAIEVLKDMIQ